MKKLIFFLFFLPIFCTAQIFRPTANVIDPPAGPFFTWTGSAFTAFSNNSGTPSLPQTKTWNAGNIVGTVTLTTTSGQGMEISVDGGANYATSQSGITGSTGSVMMRTAGATAPGSYAGNLIATATGVSSTTPFTSTVSSSGTGSDTIRVALSLTGVTAPTGFVKLLGDPSTGVRSVTNSAGTITISTVSTANWYQVSSACASDNAGKTGSTISAFPDNILLSQMYTYSGSSNFADSATQTLSKPNFSLTGLNSAATYTVRITFDLDNTRFGLTCNNKFYVKGLPATAYVNAGFNALGNLTQEAVFTSCTPDATGKLNIYLFTTPGQEISGAGGIIAYKN